MELEDNKPEKKQGGTDQAPGLKISVADHAGNRAAGDPAVTDLAALHAASRDGGGKRMWRSFDELAGTPTFTEYLDDEFPNGMNKDGPNSLAATLDRRSMLKMMAASAALAGLTGCTKLPTEHIVPYVRQPEDIIAGQPLFYATAMSLGGVATGILVESHMGRPTKIEGNPDHPASLGATDVFAQAAVLSLYDPDRSQAVVHDGRIESWSEFERQMNIAMEEQKPGKGLGLRILTESIISPSLAAQIQSLLAAYPNARWHQYESASRDTVREGSKLAFGEYINTVYRVDRAQVLLALDADFLCSGPGNVRYAREFARSRRLDDPQGTMSRLYAVEATPTNTGAKADHRLRLRAGEIESFARALAAQLGVDVAAGQPITSHFPAGWLSALAKDLQQHAGACLVIPGDQQPAVVHALAHAINQRLGNFDKTVYFTEPLEANPVNEWQSLNELTNDLRAGQVEVLIMIGGNPVYDAPADLDVKDLLTRVPFSVRLGLYEDETSALSHWHIPQTHFLEEWGDTRAFDGTVSLVQPLIAPLYNGKSAYDLLTLLNGQPDKLNHDIVQEYWSAPKSGAPSGTGSFETFWKKTLRDGVMVNSALPSKPASLRTGFASNAQPAAAGLEIVFRPDPTTWDGRFANNGWLQELPKPLTKMTWDSVAMFSPETAQRLGLKNEDTVELKYQERTILAPVWVMPGHANESVTAFLGYGRLRAGRVGTGVGFDAGWIRPLNTQWIGYGLEVNKTGKHWPLAETQHHSSMEGRDLVRVATLDEYRKNPGFAQADVQKNPLSLYPDVKHTEYQWGMAIDLNACTGCGTCVVACQSENNISVVGKEQVLRGREMHWIRIDRYYEGDLNDPNAYYEPVPCMHCEDAPCEVVCPVGATVHSDEGLNEMVYNRCVGTRYCSNNCPYKVRRFNFLLFSDWDTQSLFSMRNPNVTVRSRGVMEKCTYCVQRINSVKIEAEKADRTVKDGEIVTACQQACPSEAIVFGNVADPNSRVSKLKAKQLNYSLLAELNTRPRTTYQARLQNPNPEMPDATA
jgi:MoCo/4Fe-4S cofactor protein with predicted Tat translocation signal